MARSICCAFVCVYVSVRLSLAMKAGVSVGSLALMLTTVGRQVAFLMDHDILPKTGECGKCKNLLKGDHQVKENVRFWTCHSFKTTTSIRFDTVLYRSNVKNLNFILLAFCFTQRNWTFDQSE